LIEHGLTSAPTQYRLYGRRVKGQCSSVLTKLILLNVVKKMAATYYK